MKIEHVRTDHYPPSAALFRGCDLLLLAIVMLMAANAALAGSDSLPDALYRDHCAVCHGENGDGNTHVRRGLHPPPRDFTTQEAVADLGRERMIEAVREGRTATAMVAWKSRLSDSEIEAVVDYIRLRFMPGTISDRSRRGKSIYTQTCAVCHGDQGRGALWGQSSLNPPPRDFTSAAARRELSRARMIAAVSHGRPGTAMAAFGGQLNPADIEAVVDYVQTTFMDRRNVAAKTGAVNDETGTRPPGSGVQTNNAENTPLPMPNGLRGNAQIGKAFYLQNCTACHGTQGDGKGPRAAFIFPKPRNFQHPNSRMTYTRPVLFRAIKDGVAGREMPAWGKVLSDEQIAHVAEYVYLAFIEPKVKVNDSR